jgi:hypothetical protein
MENKSCEQEEMGISSDGSERQSRSVIVLKKMKKKINPFPLPVYLMACAVTLIAAAFVLRLKKRGIFTKYCGCWKCRRRSDFSLQSPRS